MCFLHAYISERLNDNRQKRYTEDDICHESQSTIEKVDVCPESSETHNNRSIKKNCSRYQSCTEDQLVYHCVMNGGGLVEVCAPRSHITGRFCPYYEKGIGRVIEDPRMRCTMCPFRYLSDEYFQNSECVPASVTNEDSSGQSSSTNANNVNPKANPSSTSNGIFFVNNVIDKHTEHGLMDESVASGENKGKHDREKHTDQIDTYIIVTVVVIIICSVLGISLYYRKRLTFRLIHEDGLEHNNIQKDLLEPPFNDLYPESCESMIIEKEYASFDKHDLFLTDQ